MGTNPSKAADNIYCRARKEAAKTNEMLHSREGAAEVLGYNPTTIAGWELETDKPSPDAVRIMAEVYNAPELMNHYCKNMCPLGKDRHEVKHQELDRITVMILSSMRKLNSSKEQLLDIVEDGQITEEEKPILDEIIKNFDEMAELVENLKNWARKKCNL